MITGEKHLREKKNPCRLLSIPGISKSLSLAPAKRIKIPKPKEKDPEMIEGLFCSGGISNSLLAMS